MFSPVADETYFEGSDCCCPTRRYTFPGPDTASCAGEQIEMACEVSGLDDAQEDGGWVVTMMINNEERGSLELDPGSLPRQPQQRTRS